MEEVAIPFPRRFSWPWDQTQVSSIGRQILYRLSHQGSMCVCVCGVRVCLCVCVFFLRNCKRSFKKPFLSPHPVFVSYPTFWAPQFTYPLHYQRSVVSEAGHCVCMCVCVHVHVCARSVVSYSFVIPWTMASQAPLSMCFSRQEYWSRLPFPSPADIPPDPGTEFMSSVLAGGVFTTEPPGKPIRIAATSQSLY